MNPEQECLALWRDKESYRCEVILTSELTEFILRRWQQRQECSVYYLNGTDIRDDRAGVVWQDDAEFQYCVEYEP